MEAFSDTARNSFVFFSLVRSPFRFKLFLLQKLPAAYFSGLKLAAVDEETCKVSVLYKWFTKNPFASTYFACLSMAAEMSTGILAMAAIYKRHPKISMLVVEVEGKFYKKAMNETMFICAGGLALKQTVETALATNEAQTIKVLSSGRNEQNELVAEFWITWSFRVKK